ncbi:hypothetical protein BDA96_02G111000 [Sorghum bicolor]|uniref:Uncharacterized protein n=2 Tax=Sorghum bicolor TaxID=4558 RepID=A0A921UTB1_SORBI|nr:hypothetical protein BDA96_02G111000 [Sorghum bicolor]OQU88854.1 hypothetical protein SORBI_3002G105501 [Sorghum bicolor]
MILCNFLNELDSYNSMNAAYKVQHAVRTPHASSEKKYSLVVFYQDANKVWSLLSVAINARAYYLKICMKLGHDQPLEKAWDCTCDLLLQWSWRSHKRFRRKRL